MSAYEGEFIYLFIPTLFDSMLIKKKPKKQNKMTVGNIAQNTKDITVNWNMPFDTETGGGKQNKILLRRI